jgi:hypothetical protein
VAPKTLEGRAERTIDAPADACLAALGDVERWPDWISTIRSVAVFERDDEGRPSRVGVEARLLGLPVVFAAEVRTPSPGLLTLRRLPNEGTDAERLELSVSVTSEGDRSRALAELIAVVDAPRLLPLPGPVADQLAARLLADLDARAPAAGR